MIAEKYWIESPDLKYQKQFAVIGSGATCAPIIYLQRPKWIEDNAIWETICQSVTLDLPKGFEIK